ncbi:seven-hairpin glycosidase [Dacryopinax primogenitus]|uniref:alpha-1,2-Mannosidase n=1 Tax=Dacryopinax primogenitus (strain DJM 731) TaxID=1858805 RepID=M5FS55_DACPD|nr:seven-hairpin glycosidase [Dacryopinax primogenitus]EJT97969.1 seven-hairpin glycosidase [Dacryopinax primogenitus]
MHPLALLPFLLLLIPTNARRVQHPNLPHTALMRTRAAEVRQTFEQAFEDYRLYAWGHDELAPLTMRGYDTRNGWGATIVDSMSTMLVMGLDELFLSTLPHLEATNFTSPPKPGTVSVFETIIRYVGGLVSAYELSGKKHQVLIDQAATLAHKLAHAWTEGREENAPRNMPYTWMNFVTNQPETGVVGLATAGTNILEFAKLSKYSGNATFFDLAKRSMDAVLRTTQFRPGLFGEAYSPLLEIVVNDKVSFGPNSDSFYEYLIKYAHMTGNADPVYMDTWLTGVNSAMENMLFKSTVGDWLWLSDWSNRTGYSYQFSHLACYLPGNWLLGARLAHNSTIYRTALSLAESCAHTYSSTPLGIGPESWHYVPVGVEYAAQPYQGSRAAEIYGERGYWTSDASYILRPEVVESMFYAWRITGNPIWQERVWAAFEAVRKHCKAPAGFASLITVETDSPVRKDESESFFYAELMKYFYLTFSDPSVIHLDKYTITTEAHPLLLETEQFDFGPEPAWVVTEVEGDQRVEEGRVDGCGGSGGTGMSQLMMLLDFYVPALERCSATS